VDFVAFYWVLSADNGARLKVSISRCPEFVVLREMALKLAAAELHGWWYGTLRDLHPCHVNDEWQHALPGYCLVTTQSDMALPPDAKF
jgi:uncharacterized protein YgfB (UPF0149 family)